MKQEVSNSTFDSNHDAFLLVRSKHACYVFSINPLVKFMGDQPVILGCSLIVFGLLRLVYSVVKGADPMSLPTTAWTNLKVMSVGDLTVYFLAFAIVISAVHIIRNAVGSRGH